MFLHILNDSCPKRPPGSILAPLCLRVLAADLTNKLTYKQDEPAGKLVVRRIIQEKRTEHTILQPRTNKYSADFQGCFEDVRAFLIQILCSLSIPLGLQFLKMGLVIEFGQHMSELLLKEERKGQIQCFGLQGVPKKCTIVVFWL